MGDVSLNPSSCFFSLAFQTAVSVRMVLHGVQVLKYVTALLMKASNKNVVGDLVPLAVCPQEMTCCYPQTRAALSDSRGCVCSW